MIDYLLIFVITILSITVAYACNKDKRNSAIQGYIDASILLKKVRIDIAGYPYNSVPKRLLDIESYCVDARNSMARFVGGARKFTRDEWDYIQKRIEATK